MFASFASSEPVPLVVKTPDEAEAMMEADLTRDYTDNQLEVDAVAGALPVCIPRESI